MDRFGRFLVIECGDTFEELRRSRSGGFAQWLRSGCGWSPAQTETWRPFLGEPAPPVDGFAAALISGSHAMVSHREAWSERTASWLRGAVVEGVSILGVCYGHQLIAHALGGAVGPNPQGPELGAVEIEFRPGYKTDPLFARTPEKMPVLVSHSETVLRLPQGAEVLARSRRDAHQAVRYAPNVWGVQFHPEFDPETARFYTLRMAEALRRHGQNTCDVLASCCETPQSADVLRSFGRLTSPKRSELLDLKEENVST